MAFRDSFYRKIIPFFLFIILSVPLCSKAQLDESLIYTIRPSADRNKLITGGSSEMNNLDAVYIWPSSTEVRTANWQFVFVSTGAYKIKNYVTGRFLAVHGNSIKQGAQLVLWEDLGQPDLVWRLVREGDLRTGYTYKFRNAHSGLYLAIEGGSPVNGAKLVQWANAGQADINWRLEGKPEIRDVRIVDERRGEPVTNLRLGIRTHPDGSIDLLRQRWQELFTRAFSTFKIKLNNYTPTAGEFNRNDANKFDKPNDNTIQFNEKLKHSFSMRHFRMDPATIYFINLTSKVPTISYLPGEVLVSMNYATRSGNEILANCINNIACGDGMWWINLLSMRMNIYLTPALEEGKLTYSKVRVTVSGNVRSDGSNVIVTNFNNNALFNKLADQVSSALNSNEARLFFREQFNASFIDAFKAIVPELGEAIGGRNDAIFRNFSNVSLTKAGDLHFAR